MAARAKAKRAKVPKCPCCGQRSNLRKLACTFCDATVHASRAQIRAGLHPCRCGRGQLEPVCLEDRARCFPDDAYGSDAWAELAYRFPSRPDDYYSQRARKAAQTRAFRATCAESRERYEAMQRPAPAPVEDECPF